MDHELIGASVASRLLAVGPQEVARLARAGRIPFVQTSEGKLFRWETIAQLARERQADPPRRGFKPRAK
jgi:hypothetical protein